MIADDHAAFRQVVKALLSAPAAEFVECENGLEAVAQYPRFRPDHVLMDIAMQDLDGLAATAQIKARLPRTMVVGLTVHAGGEMQQAMKIAGAETVLTKEAAVDELYHTMQLLLGSERSLHE